MSTTTTPKVSPSARKLAEELGIDPATVTGTGPNGRIVKDDVEQAAKRGGGGADPAPPAPAVVAGAAGSSGPGAPPSAAAPASASAPPNAAAPPNAVAPPGGAATDPAAGPTGELTVQKLTSIQKVVARRMVESRSTVPDFELRVEVDMEQAVAMRAGLKQAAAEGQAVPSFNDFVIRASALALRAHPRANGTFRDGAFHLHERVNVGVAVAAADALLVPVVEDADRKSPGAIARETRGLAERAREGRLTPAELDGGTFTVSNLGMFGVRSFSAVINVPQAAILAVGALEQRAVVRGGQVVPRHVMDLTLCSDHRILYGADAATFLATLRGHLEAPASLI
jgi:pyruvate dehydrogenase E2 component (dihydrolipoamide acetyltransferase)